MQNENTNQVTQFDPLSMVQEPPSILMTVKSMLDEGVPGMTDMFFSNPATIEAMKANSAIQRSYIKEWLSKIIAQWNQQPRDVRSAIDARLVLVSDELSDAEYISHFRTTVMPVIETTCKYIIMDYKRKEALGVGQPTTTV